MIGSMEEEKEKNPENLHTQFELKEIHTHTKTRIKMQPAKCTCRICVYSIIFVCQQPVKLVSSNSISFFFFFFNSPHLGKGGD